MSGIVHSSPTPYNTTDLRKSPSPDVTLPTIVLTIPSGEDLTDFLDGWNTAASGCPMFEESSAALHELINLVDAERCSPFPDRALMPVSVFMPEFDFSKVSQATFADMVACGNNLKMKNVRPVCNGCRDGSLCTVYDVLSSMMRCETRPLCPQDRHVAYLDFAASPKHLGRLPYVADFLNPFVSRPPLSNKHAVEVGGTATPPGWFSPPHSDYMGARGTMLHIKGCKLWVTFPRSVHNAEIMDGYKTLRDDTGNFADILHKVEGLSCHIVREPVAFVLEPWEYHSCFSLSNSWHIGGPAYCASDTIGNVEQINLYIDHQENDIINGDGTTDGVLQELEDTIGFLEKSSDLIEDPVQRRAARDGVDKVRERVRRLKSIIGE
jgi:hypothetical protein